jgi:dephospho-CoA kinase
MRSGKDTVADYLVKKYGFKKYAFGDALKHYFHAIFGYTAAKPREGYQWFGQSMRQWEQGVWIRKLLERLERENPERIVVTDCRQPNEYEQLLTRGFVVVRINCDEATRIERMKQAGDVFTSESLRHETELNIDDFVPHFDILNIGTINDLYTQVDSVISAINRLKM